EQSFQTVIAHDGFSGRDKALEETFDCVVLDLKLPGLNGLEVCRAIRKSKATLPVLMLTALGSIEEKVAGFDAGADDYLLKPFEFRELLARIQALAKRTMIAPDKDSTIR